MKVLFVGLPEMSLCGRVCWLDDGLELVEERGEKERERKGIYTLIGGLLSEAAF